VGYIPPWDSTSNLVVKQLFLFAGSYDKIIIRVALVPKGFPLRDQLLLKGAVSEAD
jgi:hypothetical protein